MLLASLAALNSQPIFVSIITFILAALLLCKISKLHAAGVLLGVGTTLVCIIPLLTSPGLVATMFSNDAQVREALCTARHALHLRNRLLVMGGDCCARYHLLLGRLSVGCVDTSFETAFEDFLPGPMQQAMRRLCLNLSNHQINKGNCSICMMRMSACCGRSMLWQLRRSAHQLLDTI